MKLFASALLGALLTAAFFHIALLPAYRSNYIAVGEANGRIAARWEFAQQLKQQLPSSNQSCAVLSTMFEAKTTSVHLVDCNGHRTVSVQE